MPDFNPAHLAQITEGNWHAGTPGKIGGFSFDTRQIEAGDCFVALKSESRDGHDFLVDAQAKGASCAFTERVVDSELPQLIVQDPLSAMGAIAAELRSNYSKPVIGITGSCGKTSTKEMLRLLLGEHSTHATAGNWNNRIGVPMTLFDLDPSAHAYAVIEAGINQPGEMALLGEMIRGDLTILTNIGPAHLELLGSLEGIAEEKSKLAELAKQDSPIVLPAAALKYRAFADMAERCIAVRFDGDSAARGAGQIVECNIEPSECGTFASVEIEGKAYEVQSSSLGIAQNAALAIVAARSMGIAKSTMAERIKTWRPESTRGRVVSSDGRYFYIDCYNANPASMIDSIAAFQQSAPRAMARCYVLGAMNELGESAEEYHAAVARKLSLRPEDFVFFVGPDELTGAYQRGLKSGGGSTRQMQRSEDAQSLQSVVADFSGAFFLKGSRSYHLEKLLPESLA